MARAHFLAAKIALDANDFTQALTALETTVRLNESYCAAWAHLARIYAAGGEYVKAKGCLQNAVATDKRNPVTQDLIGTVYRFLGELSESHKWHQKAVDRDPVQVPFLINLANSHLYFGDAEKAGSLLAEALAVEPDNAQLHWLLSRTTAAHSSKHIEQMQRHLQTETDTRSKAWLHYATGKECEDLQRWDEAFAAFAAGAAARRETVHYDEAAAFEIFDCAEALFTPAWMAAQTGGVANAAPIFIVGQPRTGSTLLDRMLSAHPGVTSAGELRHLGLAIRSATGTVEHLQFSPALMQAAAKADIELLAESYRVGTDGLQGEGAHFIDKLPGNYLYLPLILAAMPTARVVHVTRDPMDSCFAMYKQLFADAYLYTYDQEELARHYIRYAQLMDCWRERFPGRFHEVAYEDIVANTEDALRGVLEYVGLSWHDNCLNYERMGSAVTTASTAQVREKPHTRSVDRWRNYEKRLAPMRSVLERAGLIARKN